MRNAALAIALVALAGGVLDAPQRQRASERTARMLGPLASVHSSALWLRYHTVMAAGDEERAYAIARRALRADPDNPEGWTYLAYHFVFTRGSRLETDTSAERRRWIEAGLDLLTRGQRSPGSGAALRDELARAEALYARTVAELDPWPGARAALEQRAQAALARIAVPRAVPRGIPPNSVFGRGAQPTMDEAPEPGSNPH